MARFEEEIDALTEIAAEAIALAMNEKRAKSIIAKLEEHGVDFQSFGVQVFYKSPKGHRTMPAGRVPLSNGKFTRGDRRFLRKMQIDPSREHEA